MKLTRRSALSLSAAAATVTFAGVPQVFAADGDMHNVNDLMNMDGAVDHPVGDPDAPVTMIEYASPTCPHCARFHNDVYPEFKELYIDTGKVQFLLRPYARNVLDAVVFLVAEAAAAAAVESAGEEEAAVAGEEAYHAVVEAYFRTQDAWAFSSSPRSALLDVALQLGFTEESFEAALTNQELMQGIEAARNQASEQFDLTGTPTFYINGKQLSGEKSVEQLAAEIDPLLP